MRNRGVNAFLPLGACAGVILFCAFPLGCGTQRESREREQSNLKPLAVYYIQYLSQRGKPPTSEDDFKQFVRQRARDVDLESLFVSPRDGEPYVIVYGPQAAGAEIVAYERVGVKGRRWVADNLGGIAEVDQARFRELVPGAP